MQYSQFLSSALHCNANSANYCFSAVHCRQKSTHWISPPWYSAAIHKCKLTVRITATFPYRAPWRGGVYQLQMKMFYLDLFMKCMWDSFDKYIWEISLKNIFDKYIWQQVIFILWVCPTRHYLPGWQKEHNHRNGGYCQRRAFNADARSPSLRCFILQNQFRNIRAVWVWLLRINCTYNQHFSLFMQFTKYAWESRA